MIELILVRHAKSDWGEPGIKDHDRPLNARGERDAPAMAARLAASGAAPQHLVSSTALRARTTAAIFGEALGVEVELDPELYLAPADTLLARAVATGATGAASALIVAHDPGLSDLASRLSGGGIEGIPTCAVARFGWRAASWPEAVARVADTWSIHTPRDAGNAGGAGGAGNRSGTPGRPVR